MKKYFHPLYFSILFLFPICTFAQLDNITEVSLTFTAADGGTVTASALSNGTEFELSDIDLLESTEYTLDVAVIDGMDTLNSTISDNGENFIFFYAWDDELFLSPAGDGNIDNRADPVDYVDLDGNSLPVGLSTDWITDCGEEADSGSFRIMLLDQSGIKSESTTATDGLLVFDFTWGLSVSTFPGAPPCENEEEIITDVVLAFVPTAGGDTIFATAQDPDGEGPQDLQVVNDIELVESTEYSLSITLTNEIEGEDITEEIEEEDDEHQFFFAFTETVFASPPGVGNIDDVSGSINYNDFDENGNPVGLSTDWETECKDSTEMGTFRVLLKHQPGVKSDISTAADGDTDIDITWNVVVSNNPAAPPCENEEEVITDVELAFVPIAGGDTIFAIAQDPDGLGPQDLQVVNDIELIESTEYTLSITLTNEIEGEDITEEIEEEDDEHQFFFAFTETVFASPPGEGNIDDVSGSINYNDFDENGNPVGLSTDWETECKDSTETGTFRVLLKHQPGVKSDISTAADGDTDIDITWNVVVSNNPAAPPCENEEEVITDVALAFVPTAGGDTIFAIAQDPDGLGPQDLQIVNDIVLADSTEYTLSITLTNEIEGEDITEEIEEEDDEHQFFFEWTEGLFSDPAGNGNADNRDDPVNYNDFDENSLPVGLSTTWTTSDDAAGSFRVVLKHQPGVKSATSTIDDGDTDIDITWTFTSGVATSIKDQLQSEGLTIYPNPTAKIFKWELEGYRATTLEIMDHTGRLVRHIRQPQSEIDIHDLSKGFYFIKIESERKIWIERIVKN